MSAQTKQSVVYVCDLDTCALVVPVILRTNEPTPPPAGWLTVADNWHFCMAEHALDFVLNLNVEIRDDPGPGITVTGLDHYLERRKDVTLADLPEPR